MEDCKFEKEIIELLAEQRATKEIVLNLDRRINGSYNAIDSHIKDGTHWRRIITGACVVILVQIVAFAVAWGSLTATVKYLETQFVKQRTSYEDKRSEIQRVRTPSDTYDSKSQ